MASILENYAKKVNDLRLEILFDDEGDEVIGTNLTSLHPVADSVAAEALHHLELASILFKRADYFNMRKL